MNDSSHKKLLSEQIYISVAIIGERINRLASSCVIVLTFIALMHELIQRNGLPVDASGIYRFIRLLFDEIILATKHAIKMKWSDQRYTLYSFVDFQRCSIFYCDESRKAFLIRFILLLLDSLNLMAHQPQYYRYR